MNDRNHGNTMNGGSDRNGGNGGNATTRFPPKAVARDMGEFAHDAITLAELQVELAKVDLHEFGRHLLLPATLIVTAGTLLLGCVTAALLSLAAGLVELGVSLWLALLISAGCGLTLAAAMIGLAWRRLCRARSPFHGSTGELKQNLAWIKQMLKHRGINH